MLLELYLATKQFSELDSRPALVLDRLLAARGIDQRRKQRLLDRSMDELLESAALGREARQSDGCASHGMTGEANALRTARQLVPSLLTARFSRARNAPAVCRVPSS